MTTMQQLEQAPSTQPAAHPTEIALHKAGCDLDDATATLNTARATKTANPIAYQNAINEQAIAIEAYKAACDACNVYHQKAFGIDGESKRRQQRSFN
jgi:hypothetical protein